MWDQSWVCHTHYYMDILTWVYGRGILTWVCHTHKLNYQVGLMCLDSESYMLYQKFWPMKFKCFLPYFHLLAVKLAVKQLNGNYKWKCSLRFRLATFICWNIRFFLGSYEHESVKEWLTFHCDDLIPFRSFGTWIPRMRTAQFPWGYVRMRCLEREATALSARGNLYLKWVCSGYVNQSSWSPDL